MRLQFSTAAGICRTLLVYGLRPPLADARTARQSRCPDPLGSPRPTRPPRRARRPTIRIRPPPTRPITTGRNTRCPAPAAAPPARARRRPTRPHATPTRRRAWRCRRSRRRRRPPPEGPRRRPSAAPKQHSASVTARPPSAQSCADLKSPARRRATSTRCSAASRSRSSAGGTPRMRPCIVFSTRCRPVRRGCSPSRMTASPVAAGTAAAPPGSASSIRPTTPSTGVGSTPRPSVSL